MINLYTKRQTAKASGCFICFKQTVTVLRNDLDWFYVCDSHLRDSKFCKPKVTQVVAESVTQVVAEGATTAAETTANSQQKQLPSEFILDSVFLQMREKLKKPAELPRQIKFPEIPSTKFK